jgi:hypothetical protein
MLFLRCGTKSVQNYNIESISQNLQENQPNRIGINDDNVEPAQQIQEDTQPRNPISVVIHIIIICVSPSRILEFLELLNQHHIEINPSQLNQVHEIPECEYRAIQHHIEVVQQMEQRAMRKRKKLYELAGALCGMMFSVTLFYQLAYCAFQYKTSDYSNKFNSKSTVDNLKSKMNVDNGINNFNNNIDNFDNHNIKLNTYNQNSVLKSGNYENGGVLNNNINNMNYKPRNLSPNQTPSSTTTNNLIVIYQTLCVIIPVAYVLKIYRSQNRKSMCFSQKTAGLLGGIAAYGGSMFA